MLKSNIAKLGENKEPLQIIKSIETKN